MHRTFGYLSKRFAHIRPGEGRKVWLTFLYFFLVITAYYVVKPVSRSLVLDELGHRVVPYVDLVTAILMGPVVTLFARLVNRMPKPRLVSVSFWTVSGIMAVFWKLLALPHAAIAGCLYVWVSIFSVLVVTLFWLVANDLYRPRDAKRLFGFIGSGGILGGITGSSIAAVGAQVIGTDQLLLLSAILLVGCWAVVERLWRFAPAQETGDSGKPASPHHETFLADLRGFIRLLTQSRYLLLLVALVALNKLAGTFVYYQFNPFIEQTFPSADAKTTFNGIFFGAINLVSFVVQFFFTSWLLRRRGLLWALLILPLSLLAGSVGLLVLPLFWIAASMELCDRSLDYSVQNTAKEVLYLPIDRSIRYKIKPFIDMVVFRFGKGIAAVVGIVLLDWLGMPPRWLSLLVIPVLITWLVVALRIAREYTTTIRTVLQARAASQRPGTAPGRAAADGFGQLTGDRLGSPKLALASQLAGPQEESAPVQELLARLTQYEEPASATSQLDPRFEPDHLHSTIQERTHPVAVRRQAIRLLARSANQDALDYLCGMLVVEEDAALRDEVVRQLVALRLGPRYVQFPVALIRRQIARDVQNYERIVQVAAVYRQYHRQPIVPDDPVLSLLRVLMEESVEQVFRLLMLLYVPSDIHLIYEQMQAQDGYLRTDALELLDNLIDPPMRTTLLPLVDEDRFLSALEELPARPCEPTTAYRVLQEAIWDHNCWLSITTLCAVGRLRLTTMRQELEKASRHPEPLISAAAKVALLIVTVT
jgi:ATP/ADP translocase